MNYENICMNEDNQAKGIHRLMALTLEKGIRFKAQGEALIELVKSKVKDFVMENGVLVDCGDCSTRHLVWLRKNGKPYTVTVTETIKAGSTDWHSTAELYARLLRENGISVPDVIKGASTTAITFGFDGREHKKAYEKKLFGDDLNTIAEKLGIAQEEE